MDLFDLIFIFLFCVICTSDIFLKFYVVLYLLIIHIKISKYWLLLVIITNYIKKDQLKKR